MQGRVVSLSYAGDWGHHHHAPMEALPLLLLSGGHDSRHCRPAGGAGAVVAGLVVASLMQVGGVVVVSLALRVLRVVVVSGELTGWYYLPCGIVLSCQGWDLEKIEVL